MTTPSDPTPEETRATPAARVTLDDLIEDARRPPTASAAETEVTGLKPGLLPGTESHDPTTVSGAPTSVSAPLTSPSTPSSGPTPTAPSASPTGEPARRTGPSVPTVVWGALLALVAAAVIAHQVSTVDLNLGLSGPLVLLGAGAALVVWGIAGIGRARRR